jgi:hypothetical protein
MMAQDDPISLEVIKTINEVAAELDERFSGLAFALFVFSDDCRANYISNASRAEMKVVLQEFLDRNKGASSGTN